MNLHEDKNTFAAAVQMASRSKEEGGLGIKQIFIEKDYWITRALRMLADSSVADDAVFKGGTSLSKAYGIGNRFSEDIDIAVTKDDSRSDNQTKNLIHKISLVMSNGLIEVPKTETRKFSKYRKVFYEYPSLENIPVQTIAVTSGQILLEIVSFANPYPYYKKRIKSFITEYLELIRRYDLIETFGMESFEVNVLDFKRTSTEKLVSLMRCSLADDYISELKAKIRHFYDLHFLWSNDEGHKFLQSEQFKKEFHALLQSDRLRFSEPEGWQNRSLSESPLITDFGNVWNKLKATYLRELPDVAYMEVPQEDKVADSVRNVLRCIL